MFLADFTRAFLSIGTWIYLSKIIGNRFKVFGIFGLLLGQVLLGGLSVFLGVVIPYPTNFVLTLIIVVLTTKGEVFKFSEYIKIVPKLYLFALVVSIILALPSPVEWDDVAYHTPVVKELAAGNIKFPLLANSPYLDFYKPFSVFYGSLPYLSESLAIVPYWLSGNLESLPSAVNSVNFVILVILISKFVSTYRHLDMHDLCFICLLLLGWSPILTTFATGTTDINVALFQLASLIALTEKSNWRFWLSATFMGSAIGMKYTAIYYLPIYIWFFLKSKPSKNDFVVSSLSSFFAGGFWYVKNIVLYGNPIFPLWISDRRLPSGWSKLISDTQIGFRMPTDIYNYWRYIKINYLEEVALLIILVLIVVLLRKKFSEGGLLIGSASIHAINFFFGSQIVRFEILSYLLLVIFVLVNIKITKRISITLILVTLLMIFSVNSDIVAAKIKAFGVTVKNGSVVARNLSHGCFQKIELIVANITCTKCILNPWDPHAALITKYPEKFLSMTTYSFQSKAKDVKYIYVNKMYKSQFLADPYFHRDINVLDRDNIINDIIGKLNPSESIDNCILYEL